MKVRTRKTMLAIFIGGLCFTVSLLAVHSVANAQSKPEKVVILGGNIGGTWYPISIGLGKVLTDAGTKGDGGIGGSNSNVISVSTGKAEGGFCYSVTAAMARAAEGPFKQKITNIRGLAALWDNVMQIPVTVKSGVETVADLKGKPFALQPLSAGTTTIFRHVLAAYGLSEEDLKVVVRGGPAAGKSAVQDRRAIGFQSASTYPMSVISEVGVSISIRLLSISDEALEKMKKMNSGYQRAILPAGTYKGQDQEVRSVGAATIVIVNEKMPDDHAYWIVKTFHKRINDIRGIHKGLSGLTVEKMAKIAGVEIHPGAAKYYKEIGVL